MEFVIYILSSVGMTLFITRSYLTKNLKSTANEHIETFLNCPMCIGFWIGIIVYPIIYAPEWNCILYGFISSLSSYYIINRMES